MKYFCNFVKKMGSGQSPKFYAESIPASAGVMMGVKQQGTARHKKLHRHAKICSGEIVKDFFILDQKCGIIEVGRIGLPPL